MERIAGRRGLTITPGDVVVSRELLPKVNQRPLIDERNGGFVSASKASRTAVSSLRVFTYAASRGEELASAKRIRLLFVEDDIPTLLADYREEQPRDPPP